VGSRGPIRQLAEKQTACSEGNSEKISTFIIEIRKQQSVMSIWRVLVCIFFPPLAVVDKGCGSFLIIFLLTLCGWVPGVIGALIINNKK
jgi:uncharacterized membrane protein YqaE (UPF0057 family)